VILFLAQITVCYQKQSLNPIQNHSSWLEPIPILTPTFASIRIIAAEFHFGNDYSRQLHVVLTIKNLVPHTTAEICFPEVF